MKYDTPLYMKLYNEILAAIESLEYEENSQLPPECYLSNRCHISRTTVCTALDRLSQDGYIHAVHGDASFVQPQVFEQSLSGFYSFTSELKNNNILTHSDPVDYQVIQLDYMLTQKLSYPIRSIFHHPIRLRSAQNCPLMLETTYLPKGHFHQLSIGLLENKGSLYEYLERKYDFRVDHATGTSRPIMADRKERELLRIPNPILCQLLGRYSYEKDSTAECTYSVIREGKCMFKVNLK